MARPAHRPTHVPTEKNRKWVRISIAGGITQADIACGLDLSRPTLRKHYKAELAQGTAEAHGNVNASLYTQCMKGNITAIIWWDKTRRGMSEKQRVETTGPDGRPIEQLVTYRWADPVKE